MKRIYFYALVIMIGFILSGCKSREERVIERLDNLAEKIQNESSDWDIEQWQDVAKDFEDLNKEAEKCDFSEEQMKQLGEAEGRVIGAFYKEGSQFAGKMMEEYLRNAGNLIEGFQKGFDESDVNSSIDGMLNGLESDLNSLKDASEN